jgi:hypothetical protein
MRVDGNAIDKARSYAAKKESCEAVAATYEALTAKAVSIWACFKEEIDGLRG